MPRDRAKEALYDRQRYLARKQAGVCGRCGAPPDPGYVCCSRCRKKSREGQARIRARRAAEGYKCTSCGIVIRENPQDRLCPPCKMASKERKRLGRKDRNTRERLLVFQHYGMQCACCGESEFAFLEIDHINNDGARDRKQKQHFYRSYIERGFPDGLQTLCSNCNSAKQRYGICPHQAGK